MNIYSSIRPRHYFPTTRLTSWIYPMSSALVESLTSPFDPRHWQLSGHIQQYWTDFANNGNPNASGSVRLSGSHHVQWSKYDPNVGNYLTLDDPIFEDEQIKDGRCNFWDKWDPPF
jgi:hypothetical protein